jgi:hypothetical protein
MALAEVRERLVRISQGQSSAGGQSFDWRDLIGESNLLRGALHDAVCSAATHDPGAELREIWDLMVRPASLARLKVDLAIQYAVTSRETPPWADRLHRHASLLIASAAIECCRARANAGGSEANAGGSEANAGGNDAWQEQLAWWIAAGGRFGFAIGAQPDTPPDWPRSLAGTCAALQAAGWDANLLGYWSRYWGEKPRVLATCRAPVVGVCNGRGFLAHLILEWIERRPFTIEHPEGALAPYGESLLATVAAVSRGSAKGVAWHIRVLEKLPKGVLPLDGSSLGGAAAVGFRLLNRGRPYKADTILICAVGANGRLERVGGEVAKLQAARDSGIRRAGIAMDSDLSADDQARLTGLTIERLRTVREAERFVDRIPYL